MATLFHGNPMSTTVGQLIEQATDGSLATENWALYMDICDVINETDEGPKDAVRAFRKKISQSAGKNYTSVMYCLTCIESCVKNCGRRFHMQVASKDFLHDLIKIIGPKNDPPLVVQEKVLSMIQTWADAFRGNPELKEVEKVYQDLKQKGIEFPMTDLDNLAPIHTPARSVPDREVLSQDRGGSIRGSTQDKDSVHDRGGGSRGSASPAFPAPAGYQPAVQPPVRSGTTTLSADQTCKLRRDLELVQGNIHVMSDMLTELNPALVDPSDLELLQELNRTCRQMQSRLVELLNEIATEEITNDLLRVNDDLNNVFLRYERFERYRTGQTGQQSNPAAVETDDHLPPSYDQLPAATNPKVGNLIDLDEPLPPAQSVSTHMAGLSLASRVSPTLSSSITSQQPQQQEVLTDEFDMFAQSRQSFDQHRQNLGDINYSPQQGDTYKGGLVQAVNQKANLQDKETDYDEMEQWLATHGAGSTRPQEPITSSEFDRFLSERATATDRLPPGITAQTGSQQPASRPTRTIQKQEEDESPLFAL